MVCLETGDDLFAAPSLVWVVHKHALQVLSGQGAHGGGDGDAPLLDGLEAVVDGGALVEVGARQHLVEDDPECPDVTLLGVGVEQVGFGGHVPGRTHIVECFGLKRLHLPAVDLAVPEVDDLRLEGADE